MNPTEVKLIIKELLSHATPNAVEGMARFGITAKKVYGISAPVLKAIAKKIGKNHELAMQLWKTEIYDARVIAFLIDEPEKVTEEQMEAWVSDFDSWAICDGCCLYLFWKPPYAWKKAVAWSKRKEEFVKRAGFTLMAVLAVHDKKADDNKFEKLFSVIKREATDERNFVRKAVNWALRQIGKRNVALNKKAIQTAKEIQQIDFPSAQWIAADALRELRSESVQKRLKRKKR
ncbi:MAG: DNA alkylation repair protein [Bacteroidetes bacterium]|nr:MAG: DNA alkylation repair protein [Bacteroidota bacterium]